MAQSAQRVRRAPAHRKQSIGGASRMARVGVVSTMLIGAASAAAAPQATALTADVGGHRIHVDDSVVQSVTAHLDSVRPVDTQGLSDLVGSVGSFSGTPVPELGSMPQAPSASPSSSHPVLPPAGFGSGQAVADAAMSKLGSPYAYGATGPSSFDCSGLTSWAYSQVGKAIPRVSSAQFAGGTKVAMDALQPGDIVSFYGANHVGIYVGNGNVVHAPTEGDVVKITALQYMPADGAVRY